MPLRLKRPTFAVYVFGRGEHWKGGSNRCLLAKVNLEEHHGEIEQQAQARGGGGTDKKNLL